MPDPTPFRQLCVLLRDGRVLTDDDGGLPSSVDDHPWIDLGRRALSCGDPSAVLVAPQLPVSTDGHLLMNVFASRTNTDVEGSWTALDEIAGIDSAASASLRVIAEVVAGRLGSPARRPDWFRASWYDEADAWIDAALAARGRSRTGPTVPMKVWSLSAVLRVPSDPTPIWMKASCRHFHAEPALTRLVAEMLPAYAPPLIAVDEARGWLLLEDMPGADEEHEDAPPAGLGAAAGGIAATVQRRSLDHLDDIEAAGVPVRALTETLHGFDEVLSTGIELVQLGPDELAAARAVRDDVHEAAAELATLGLPDTLVHGDLHPGNVAHDGDSVMLYDWSDAAVSHPMFDLVHLTDRLPDAEAERAKAAYVDVWREAYPAVDYDRALELAAHVEVAFQVVSYEQIYRDQEDASYWEMSGVVARILRKLPARFPRSGG